MTRLSPEEIALQCVLECPSDDTCDTCDSMRLWACGYCIADAIRRGRKEVLQEFREAIENNPSLTSETVYTVVDAIDHFLADRPGKGP